MNAKGNTSNSLSRDRIILFYLLFFCSFGFSQNNKNQFQAWKLVAVSGETRINGLFRESDITRSSLSEQQRNFFFNGGVLFRTKNYILHPNFMVINTDAGYFPGTNRTNYIVIPDQAEVSTLKKLGVAAYLFPQKIITFSTTVNFNESYQSRENITDIKSKNKQWNESVTYNNKYLPITAGFNQNQWEQKETETNRKVIMDERTFNAQANKSFTSRDKNELTYTHNNFVNINESLLRIANRSDNVNLHNNMYLDKKRNYVFNSFISKVDQVGNVNFKRFQALENLTLKLPGKFTYSTNYNFFQTQYDASKLNQQNLQSTLLHQLFQSLHSKFIYDYNIIRHTVYKEEVKKIGVDLQYTKKIPAQGRLSLSSAYFRARQNMVSAPSSILFRNESQTLNDGTLVLLIKPYVSMSSVVVKDATGTIIYQENLDYVLIDRAPYLEIRRVPGGLIPNNSTVYVDYIAIQPGAYKYDSDNQSFTADVMLFNRKLSVYYKISTQDYFNKNKIEFLTLNYYTQTIKGIRLDFNFINGGAEYEKHNSTLIPFRRLRYFVNIQKNINNKIFVSLNGNMQDYELINENEIQKYSDVTGKIVYSLSKQIRINLDCMYRNQSGRGIDLSMITAKSELIANIRQLNLIFGVEFYKRNYVDENLHFRGTYFSLTRRF